MANSREAAVAALEVYETLVEEIGRDHARKALHVLDGMRAPALNRIDLMQKQREMAQLLADRPALPVPFLAERLRVSHSTIYRWLSKK